MDRRFAVSSVLTFALSASLSAQPAPPYGLAQIHSDNSIVVYWFYPDVNDTVLASGDGDPQSYLFYSSEDVGARVAVGFELAPGAHAVQAVEVRLWPEDPFPHHNGDSNSPFKLGLHSRLDSNPVAQPLWSSGLCSNSEATSNWLSIPVRKRAPADSLYLEFEWLPGLPTAPLPSMYYTGGFVGSFTGHIDNGRMIWAPISDGGLLMRLRVSESDLQGELPAEDVLPDSFTVLVFDAPTDYAFDSPLMMTVEDSLHLEMNKVEVEGKYAVVAAWKDDMLGPKSEMIKLDATTSVPDEERSEMNIPPPQNYPNPFNSETSIELRFQESVEIFDVLGRRVVSIQPRVNSPAGLYTCRWDGRDSSGRLMPSGVYFYRQVGASAVGKMILLK